MAHPSRFAEAPVAVLAAGVILLSSRSHASSTGGNEDLWRELTRSGTVRVIASLAVREPTGSRSIPLSDERARITRLRTRVVRRLRGTRFAVRRSFETLPAVALEVDASALAALESSDDVVALTEDRLHAPALENSTVMIEAVSTWAAGFDGRGQVVAILDTGVDATHPFLEGAVVDEACFSDTGDCVGGGRERFGPGAAAPCTFSPSICAHGTHVAGIVSGRGPLRSGVAPGASIIAIQVFSRSDECRENEAAPCPRTRTSDYLRGLEYVYRLRDDYPIAAVNLSFTGRAYGSSRECDEGNAAVKDAIDNLRAAGIATIAAAGNDHLASALGSPACISSAVSVGAVERESTIADFSNRSPFLSFVAPGRGITSAVPGGGFASKNGTSMAAPHVAGAWALLRQYDPRASVDLISTALSMRAPQIPDPDNDSFVPLLDVRAALEFLSGDCACRPDVENFCEYPPDHCRMTTRGGFCDPDGDGDRGDADWVRGWSEFQSSCGTPRPTPRPGRAALAPWLRKSRGAPASPGISRIP